MYQHLPGSKEGNWTQGRWGEYSNILGGTRQELMEWNKHVQSLLLHILPNSNQIRTENAFKTLDIHFLALISLNKMASIVHFTTP